ncbi:MAG: hypothetical protein GY737_02485 [Desulfobacteraceae bacterium]|nr:hypothetical protein [Desulfobacteraceae bacterium]
MATAKGRDSNSAQLAKNYKDLHKTLSEIESIINNLKKTLGRVEQLLEIPEDISKDLSVIDDILTALIDLTTALAPVPYVGEVTTVISRVLNSLKPPVHNARTAVNKVADEIKPYIKDVVSFRNYLIKIGRDISELDKFITLESKSLKNTDAVFQKMPKNRYKEISMNSLESFSGRINQIIAKPMKAVDVLIKQGSLMKEALDGVSKFFNELERLSRPIEPFLKDLQAMQNIFNEIDKLLKTRIGVGSVSITIDDLLNAEKNIPFHKELMKKATSLLDKPLKALDPNIGKKSPNTNSIQSLFGSLFTHLFSVSSIIKRLETEAESVLGKNSVEKQIAGLLTN